ncbi:CBS domain-containing protein [Desulfopila sp. IMCC35006]|uniref:CBS domain-containing protein n=1 Tax=Desulfopila sp. IMCC35006 TaxID=2569542 RepID=UPI0010AC487D|nr:CBS domain-containing protein [Desulfopila sp. IMCC35006]TKB26931.1 CBS domain-containing protein [Desulfopila sp. IMCC35006]
MLIATTHKNTDFDGLASVIAATLLYPGCVGVVPKMTNKNVEQFLSTHKTAFNLILPHEVPHDDVKKLIVLDTDQWQRLDRLDKLAARQDLEIDLWDHHMMGRGDIVPSWSCKEQIGSTVTLLVREMKKRRLALTPLDSTVMLIGLYEDTGHLSYPSTTAEDARAAAYLLDHRADLNVAAFFLNPPYEENQKEILFEMMKETEKFTINRNTIGFNTISLDKKVTNLAAVVNMYRKIVNVDALFVIFTNDDRNTIIGRSGSENINVGKVLAVLGGGGHAGAGSATVKSGDMSPRQIKKAIIAGLASDKTESARISDIMSFPVISVPPSTPMRDVQSLMAAKKIRGIMVMEDDEIHGIIVLWDFKRVKKEQHWDSPVKAFMARNIVTIAPGAAPSVAAGIMIEKDVGYLPVVENGKVIGIVTRTDILTYYYDLLPE